MRLQGSSSVWSRLSVSCALACSMRSAAWVVVVKPIRLWQIKWYGSQFLGRKDENRQTFGLIDRFSLPEPHPVQCLRRCRFLLWLDCQLGRDPTVPLLWWNRILYLCDQSSRLRAQICPRVQHFRRCLTGCLCGYPVVGSGSYHDVLPPRAPERTVFRVVLGYL